MTGPAMLTAELLEVARDVDGALFLTGSQYYAGHGEDFDFRFVVGDPMSLAGHEYLARYASPLLNAGVSDADVVGLKFHRHGCVSSVQLLSRGAMQRLCRLENFVLRVFRTTETTRTNDVYGLDGRFEVAQRHRAIGNRAWLVEIDQTPMVDGAFVTQVYHNMIIGCRVLRAGGSFTNSRASLLRATAARIAYSGLSLERGFARLLGRSFGQWTSEARTELLDAVRDAVLGGQDPVSRSAGNPGPESADEFFLSVGSEEPSSLLNDEQPHATRRYHGISSWRRTRPPTTTLHLDCRHIVVDERKQDPGAEPSREGGTSTHAPGR